MYTVALTGGIGSGKSTVADIFKTLGICIVDADVIARELVQPGKPALLAIQKTFGAQFITETGELNREAIRRLIFTDRAKRRQLEAILHPRVRASISAYLARCTSEYALAVVPLLIESNWQHEFDRTLIVDVPESLQIDRVQTRSALAREDVEHIMQSQARRADRLKYADDVIHNDGDIQQLHSRVLQLHQHYRQLARQ